MEALISPLAVGFELKYTTEVESEVDVSVRPTACWLCQKGALKHASCVGHVQLEDMPPRLNVHANRQTWRSS